MRVPLPDDRRPTDWERATAGLETARWITADLTYRRAALSAVGGFDERFPRAFREDADLALRVGGAEGRIVRGTPVRCSTRCGRPTTGSASASRPATPDDASCGPLHGPDWRRRAGATRGRRPRHAGVTALGVDRRRAGAAAGRRRLRADRGCVRLARRHRLSWPGPGSRPDRGTPPRSAGCC